MIHKFLSKHSFFVRNVAYLVILVAVFATFIPGQAKALTITPIRIELAADPGASLSSEFRVYNDTNQTQTFYTSVQNFEAQDEAGNPKFVNTKEGLALWVVPEASVVAKPKEEVTIHFKINVPQNADAGGYFAGIFASTTPPTTNQANVSLGSRIGTLLFFRVNGDVPEGISILQFGTNKNQRFFTSLPVTFYYRFQNSGADRIMPLGDILVHNIFGHTTKILNANAYQGNVLPKSIRRFESSWIESGGSKNQALEDLPKTQKLGFFSAARAEVANFAFGPYVGHLNLAYGNVTAKSATATFTFFIIPWQLIIIVLVVLIIVLFLFRRFIRGYNQRIINEARKQR